MQYALIFLVMGVVTGAYAIRASNWWAHLGLGWLAISLFAIAGAYLTRNPRLLMKRPDGSRPAVAWLLFAPSYFLSLITFYIYVLTARELPAVEVAPNLWLGRRMSARQMQTTQNNWSGVIDLAAEFPRSAPNSVDYLSLPVLDGTGPTLAQLEQALNWINARVTHGPVYVHCALGHGRSATLAAAYLLRHRRAETIQQAIEQLKRCRPGVDLHGEQTRVLQSFVWEDNVRSEQ